MFDFWKRHHNAVFLLLLLLVAALPFIKYQKASKPTNGGIVVSFYPLGEFARHVVGDTMTVTIVTPAGTEPHDYEPTAQDMVAIRSSRIFIYNGNGVDGWAEKIVPELIQDHVAVINMSQRVHVESTDPHLWLDPILAGQMVLAIQKTAEQIDPTHADIYKKNASAYLKELTALHLGLQKGLKTCVRRDIVVSHAAFEYFTKRYNLKQVYIAGVSPEDEPSPKRLAEIAAYAKQHKVTHIFFESLVSPKLSETIASEVGAKTAVLNPIEGLSDAQIKAGYNYVKVMRQNLTNLRVALACQ